MSYRRDDNYGGAYVQARSPSGYDEASPLVLHAPTPVVSFHDIAKTISGRRHTRGGLGWDFFETNPYREYYDNNSWPSQPCLKAELHPNVNGAYQAYHLILWPDASWWVMQDPRDGKGRAPTRIHGGQSASVEAASVAAELYVAGLSRPVQQTPETTATMGRMLKALPSFGGTMDNHSLATTNGNSKKLAKKATGTMLTDALAHGAKVAVADEASTVVLNLAKMLIGDAYPEFFKSKQGEDLAKIITATGLYHLASNNPDMIPMGEGVAAACSLVIEASSRDIVQPHIAKAGDMFAILGKLGAGLGGAAAAK